MKSPLELGRLNRVLLVNDMAGHLADFLTDEAIESTGWQRLSHGPVLGEPWVPQASFDGCIMRISKSKAAFDMELHAVASVLEPGAPIWICGANDEGIRSIARRASGLFPDITTVDTRNHCRILLGHRTEKDEAKAPLANWLEERQMDLDGRAVSWVTFPGVFGAEKVDFGTQLLLEALPQPEPGLRVLDFACGPGAIGAALMARESSIVLHCTEADAVALEACKYNLPTANHHLGDGWRDLEVNGFDWVVSNPPIHFGKSEDFRVLRSLVTEARQYLSQHGVLWMVVQRRIAMEQMLADHFSTVNLVADGNQFRVWKAC